MLDAVDQDRGLRPVGEPEQAFQPEESWPEHRGENGEELREGDRVDRLAAAECESLHAMRAAVCARRRMECRPAGGGEEIRRRQLPRGAVEDGRDGVESPQGGAEFGKARSSLPSRQKVCLRHDEAVGERDLACALRTGGDCRGSVDGVDNRRDSAEREPNGKLRVGDHGVEHGRGLGEPGRLQHDQAEWRQRAGVPPRENVAHGVDEVAAQGATDAASVDQDGVAGQALVEQIVQSDLAPFVDDDQRVGEVGRAQEPIDQRRLAGAEKASHDVKRDRRAPGPVRPCG